MDAGARGLVGAAAARWSRSPAAVWYTGRRSCSSTARGVPRSRRRVGPASASSRRGIAPPGSPATGRASSCACRATSPAPRRRIGRRARSGGSRSQGSLSCDWRKDASTQPSRRSVAPSRPRRRRSTGRDSCPPSSRSCWRLERLDGARRACVELEQIATGYESAMLGAMVAHARGAVHLADGRAARGARRPAEGGRDMARARRSVRDRADARARRATRAALLGDEEAAALEHEAARDIFERSVRSPTSRGSRRRRRASTGSRAASSRSCGSSPPARRTARSLRRS